MVDMKGSHFSFGQAYVAILFNPLTITFSLSTIILQYFKRFGDACNSTDCCEREFKTAIACNHTNIIHKVTKLILLNRECFAPR